ncbi:hypothetical protein OS493_026763 [Desmophyllum pertusum]|uniref:Uncharacterized protein n=1 Tax=Desmophyllum pertusum TaxID=174260 RepID=A0A9X0D1N0_9CNID|nr:hypothetical protein OS493_026763 [Desmophyllum pertusum]
MAATCPKGFFYSEPTTEVLGTDCETGWGLVSGPVTAKETDEETPTESSNNLKTGRFPNIVESEKRGCDSCMEVMCTAEGCGPTSVPLPFAGEEKKLNKRQIYDHTVESNVHWIVIGIVGCQQRENQAPLQQRIQLDPVYGNMEDSSSSRRHSYEEIQLHDPEENLRGMRCPVDKPRQ